MKSYVWMVMICSLLLGAVVGAAIDAATHKTAAFAPKPVQESCQWRDEPGAEKRTINCFSILDGAYRGHVEEENFGWNAYAPIKDSEGKITTNKYATFIDLQSAEKYVNERLGAL